MQPLFLPSEVNYSHEEESQSFTFIKREKTL